MSGFDLKEIERVVWSAVLKFNTKKIPNPKPNPRIPERELVKRRAMNNVIVVRNHHPALVLMRVLVF